MNYLGNVFLCRQGIFSFTYVYLNNMKPNTSCWMWCAPEMYNSTQRGTLKIIMENKLKQNHNYY